MTPEFDHYTISRVLGEGGMGLVYLATDTRTGLPVAIKVMSGAAFDPDLQARFLKENRILSALNHRNIVRCYEITESRDGLPSIVMEYVDGVDFRAFEGHPYPELLPLMIQALMGLAYLRSQNILHRDLSSNNIFVTLENQTRVTKILDFGVAKILQQQAIEGDVKTRTGQFLGKFAFASPEHFSGLNVDWRSDVYSLGVIFHRLLTGEPPLKVARKSNYYDWLLAHQKDEEAEVASPPGVPPLPESLRSVVRRMLSKAPGDRPQSYEDVIHVLDRIQRGLPTELEPDPVALATLPPAVEGRIGASGKGKIAPTPSPAWDANEAPQQKRWPDLEVPEPHTERFAAVPEPDEPDVRDEPAPEPSPEANPADTAPSSTELLVPQPVPEPARTAPTAVSPVFAIAPDVPIWAGGAATEVRPGPASAPHAPPAPPAPPAPSVSASQKTERLDDVIEKLRQRSSVELLPPLTNLAPVPEPPPARPAPPPPAEAPPAPPPSRAAPPRSPARPGQRLVVYGAPAPAAPSPRRAPPAAPPAPARAPAAPARRFGGIEIGVIVAAIVILFAAVLWVLVTLARRAGAPRRSAAAAGREFLPEASAVPPHSTPA